MNSQASIRRSRTSSPKPAAAEPDSATPLGAYHQRVNALAERIRGTSDVGAIIEMLNQAIAETRRLRTREDELQAAQRKVAEAERSIESMKSELEQVKAMLQQDPLTGTLNRRGIDEAFRQEASRCDRHGSRLSVAIVDLDDFKALNDTHGHPVGDRALVHVCALIRRTLRPTDRVGRLGGEEFFVLLPDAGPDEAAAVMARVQRELAALPLTGSGETIAITFSCGIAERSAHEPFDALAGRADAALYRAKRAGKNRCISAA
ncbi:MAG: diguanylate cyclase [Betaproteobacteria bacterium]|nr:diguanylate cyclase [Betaproteobacteria bacterium]